MVLSPSKADLHRAVLHEAPVRPVVVKVVPVAEHDVPVPCMEVVALGFEELIVAGSNTLRPSVHIFSVALQ